MFVNRMARLIRSVIALILCSMLLVSCCITTAYAQSYEAVVTGGWLRLRAAPSFDAPTLTSVNTGTHVTVLTKRTDRWCYVRLQNGLTGYMYGTYLKRADEQTTGIAYVISANGGPVRLRNGPGLQYSVIGQYNVGTKVTILRRSDGWAYIKAGSRYGYMMTSFLSTTSPSTPERNYTAYVTSANGRGVRMRTGPGADYDVIRLLQVGTEITVLQYGDTWCQIRCSGINGYMMTRYITRTAPSYEVLGVSLSNTQPSVGSTVRANVEPSSATVSCTWYDDNGNELGSGVKLLITSAMNGKRIRAVVTGTGLYTGTCTSDLSARITSGVMPVRLESVTINNAAPCVGTQLRAVLLPSNCKADITWYDDTGVQIGYGQSYTVAERDTGRRIYCIATGYDLTTGTATSEMTAAVIPFASISTPQPLITELENEPHEGVLAN